MRPLMDEEYFEYLVSLGTSRDTIDLRRSSFKQFAAWRKIAGVSESPAEWRREVFEAFHDYLRNHTYRIADNRLGGYQVDRSRRVYVTKRFKTDTVAAYLTGLKDYLLFLYEHKRIDSFPFEGLEYAYTEGDLKKDVTEDEIARLVAVVPLQTREGLRDRTIIELMYGAGLRKGEVRRLDVGDLSFVEGTILVHGKNRRQRLVPMGAVVREFLRVYLNETRPRFLWRDRNLSETALFLSNRGARVSPAVVGRSVMTYARAAGLHHITPHKLRHAFALHMMRAGCDIRYIQELMGHEKLETTTVYTEVYDYDLVEKVRRYHPGCAGFAGKQGV